jgi:hypothetical protein
MPEGCEPGAVYLDREYANRSTCVFRSILQIRKFCHNKQHYAHNARLELFHLLLAVTSMFPSSKVNKSWVIQFYWTELSILVTQNNWHQYSRFYPFFQTPIGINENNF